MATELYPKVGRGFVAIAPDGSLSHLLLDSGLPVKVKEILEYYDRTTLVVGAWPRADNLSCSSLFIHSITAEARTIFTILKRSWNLRFFDIYAVIGIEPRSHGSLSSLLYYVNTGSGSQLKLLQISSLPLFLVLALEQRLRNDF